MKLVEEVVGVDVDMDMGVAMAVVDTIVIQPIMKTTVGTYNRESAPAGQGAFKDAPPKRRFSGGDGDGRPSERRGYVTYFIMNPTRLAFIRSTLCRHFRRDPLSARPFEGLKFIDVGCGGGILSELLARMRAAVTGVDAVKKNIKIARFHSDLDPVTSKLECQCTTAEIVKTSSQLGTKTAKLKTRKAEEAKQNKIDKIYNRYKDSSVMNDSNGFSGAKLKDLQEFLDNMKTM